MAAPKPDSRVQAYVELTKMRISVMVLVTFVVAAALAAEGMPSLSIMFWGSIGMMLWLPAAMR